MQPCSLIRIVTLNRSTLQVKSSGNDCFFDTQVADFLNGPDESDLVIVNAGDSTTGLANFNLMGGSFPSLPCLRISTQRFAGSLNRPL
jgi:hypothetical protein